MTTDKPKLVMPPEQVTWQCECGTVTFAFKINENKYRVALHMTPYSAQCRRPLTQPTETA